MLITAVIRDTENVHIIYFLLIAYIQSMRLDSDLNFVSKAITLLPLTGVQDISRRLVVLFKELDNASQRLDDNACAAIKEALQVFATALSRLRFLNHKQSGNRIHAQSL